MLSTNEVRIIINLLDYNQSTNAFTMHRIKGDQVDMLLFFRKTLKRSPNAPVLSNWILLKSFIRV